MSFCECLINIFRQSYQKEERASKGTEELNCHNLRMIQKATVCKIPGSLNYGLELSPFGRIFLNYFILFNTTQIENYWYIGA